MRKRDKKDQSQNLSISPRQKERKGKEIITNNQKGKSKKEEERKELSRNRYAVLYCAVLEMCLRK